MRKISYVIAAFCMFVAGCSAVGSSKSNAKDSINQTAQDNQTNVYVAKNGTELSNYNKRLKIADDPTTILWCTFAFPVPGAPLVTVPIVGKLTSGGKRPFPQNNLSEVGNSNSTENPDGQGMYGTSGDFRYGFTPEEAYADMYNLSTFCTTTPMVWQKEKTVIALATDPALATATATAKAQLKAKDPNGANSTLKSAIAAAGGK